MEWNGSPPWMADLKRNDQAKDCVVWGTLFARKHKTKEVMQFAFKDNALVLAMSTHFSGWEISPWRKRKRPAATSTSAKTARIPFGNQPMKMLQIPCLIDRYNNSMNGVDIGDQLRAEFESGRRIRRGGHQALTYLFLLEVVVTNAFLLQREGWPTASNIRCTDQTTFRMALVEELLTQYGQQVALQSLEASHIPKGTNASQAHTKVRREKRGWCAFCSSKRQNTVLSHTPVQSVVRKHSIQRGCLECNVALCQNCWDNWHA
jgi:hypothetical protein